MSSVDHLRQFVGERLTAAAEEIFGVFQKTIVQYEKEIGRQRKLLDVVLKPEIKLCRIELPQHCASKEEEVLVEQQQQLWNQERNSSVDQVDPESPQIKEEQEEVCSSQLGVKQENQDLMLISKSEENHQREDQTGPSEESAVKFPFLVSVVSGANSELQQQQQQQQQLSNTLDGAESQDQNEGKREELESKELNNKYCQSDTNDVNKTIMLKTDSVTGKKSFPCDTCGKNFKHRGYLRMHMKSHTGDRPYTCNTCGKVFLYRSSLLRHTRRHTGERPYNCRTCGKTFTGSSGLVDHIRRIHTGERPYICKTCGKGFTKSGEWRQHIRKHTGEKPYLCKTCGRAFSVGSNLMRHQRLHTGERPFICKMCGKDFVNSSDLVVHVRRIHTGEKLHTCNTCSRKFVTSSELSAHMRRIHAGSTPCVS